MGKDLMCWAYSVDIMRDCIYYIFLSLRKFFMFEAFVVVSS